MTRPAPLEPLFLHWSEDPNSGAEIIGWGGDPVYQCRDCLSEGSLAQFDHEEAMAHSALHEAAAAARAALLDELETAVETMGGYDTIHMIGEMVQRAAVIREINRRRP